MDWRSRKVRIAIVLALAVFAAITTWRMGQSNGGKPPCTPGRQEEKDSSGKVVRITHTTCLD